MLALTAVSFTFLKAKVGMLDNLLDIEVAYSLLKSGDEDLAKDPLDVNYEKLKTDLEVKKLFQISLIYFWAITPRCDLWVLFSILMSHVVKFIQAVVSRFCCKVYPGFTDFGHPPNQHPNQHLEHDFRNS